MKLDKHLILGIFGKKQSGKDTFASMLSTYIRETDRLHTLQLKFATPIKELIAELTGGSVEMIENNKNHPAMRFMLQRLGTEYGRFQSEAYWLDVLAQQIRSIETPSVIIITDVRFQNEADFVTGQNGYNIRVRRHENQTELPLVTEHVSETELEHIDHDFWIDNNSTLALLEKEAIYCWTDIKERYEHDLNK